MIQEFLALRPFFEGDFYVLGSQTEAKSEWCIYQGHRSDLNAGFVLAFRRPASPYRQADVFIQGLRPDGNYHFEITDLGKKFTIVGKELIEKGFALEIPARRQSILVRYQLQ
jgi:hypothetical protein